MFILWLCIYKKKLERPIVTQKSDGSKVRWSAPKSDGTGMLRNGTQKSDGDGMTTFVTSRHDS